jgi:hypothetical protein
MGVNNDQLKGASKDTNPKDALGVAKAPFHCVSARVMLELGLAMMEGGRKYGTHNYRAMGVRGSVYYDATMRHMMAWWEGQDIDPDSGVSHIVKAIAGLVVMRDSMLMKNFEDDRPIRLPDGLNINDLNEQAKAIIEKYPISKLPFTEAQKVRDEEQKQHPMRTVSQKCPNTYSPLSICKCSACELRRKIAADGIRRIEQKEGLGRVREPWNNYECSNLIREVSQDLPINAIASLHQRSVLAIESRMEKLKIDYDKKVEHEENKITYDNVVVGGYANLDRLCKCRTCRLKWHKNLLP